MKETWEEFSKRIWHNEESDNIPKVEALIEIAWQLKRIADQGDEEIDPYSMEGTGVEVEEAKG